MKFFDLGLGSGAIEIFRYFAENPHFAELCSLKLLWRAYF